MDLPITYKDYQTLTKFVAPKRNPVRKCLQQVIVGPGFVGATDGYKAALVTGATPVADPLHLIWPKGDDPVLASIVLPEYEPGAPDFRVLVAPPHVAHYQAEFTPADLAKAVKAIRPITNKVTRKITLKFHTGTGGRVEAYDDTGDNLTAHTFYAQTPEDWDIDVNADYLLTILTAIKKKTAPVTLYCYGYQLWLTSGAWHFVLMGLVRY